jgi:PAS domain-containing protein
MAQIYEALYEELLQFLYRTPWGLIQATRTGAIQMLNPAAARSLMPLTFNGRLENIFDLLRVARPELQTLVKSATERCCVICEDLPLPGLLRQEVGPGSAPRAMSVSVFLQNQETIMVILREAQILQPLSQTKQTVELDALQNLTALGVIKTRNALITWSNPAAQRMLGYPASQLQDAPFTDLFAQGVGELLMENCQPALMSGVRYTDRLTLLPRRADSVTLDLTATSTSFVDQEILWTLMETRAA